MSANRPAGALSRLASLAALALVLPCLLGRSTAMADDDDLSKYGSWHFVTDEEAERDEGGGYAVVSLSAASDDADSNGTGAGDGASKASSLAAGVRNGGQGSGESASGGQAVPSSSPEASTLATPSGGVPSKDGGDAFGRRPNSDLSELLGKDPGDYRTLDAMTVQASMPTDDAIVRSADQVTDASPDVSAKGKREAAPSDLTGILENSQAGNVPTVKIATDAAGDSEGGGQAKVDAYNNVQSSPLRIRPEGDGAIPLERHLAEGYSAEEKSTSELLNAQMEQEARQAAFEGPCGAVRKELAQRRDWLVQRRLEQFALGGAANAETGIPDATWTWCEAHPDDVECHRPSVTVFFTTEELKGGQEPEEYDVHVVLLKRSLAKCVRRYGE